MADGVRHTPGEGEPWAELILVRMDGSDGPAYPLDRDEIRVGREGADLCFADDAFLANHEFTIERRGDGPWLVPEPETLNGTFFRIREGSPVGHGDEIRIGQELLRLEMVDPDAPVDVDDEGTVPMGGVSPPGLWGRLLQVFGAGEPARVFLLSGAEIHLGREEGAITFPYDGYVSGRHARLLRTDDGRCSVEDLGSSNGTFLRLREPVALKQGDRFLAGQHLFKFHAHGT